MKRLLTAIFVLGFSFSMQAQGLFGGKVTGNFQMDIQASKEDSTIGAQKVNEKLLMNTYTNIIYTNGDFSAGIRYEAYLNPILGFDAQYKGAGFASRWATYKKDFLEVTIGNYYEQFGSGLIFRSYQEPNLGIDNAMDGAKVVLTPFAGVTFKGIIGKQRYYWEDVWANDDFGLVRGFDGEVNLNSVIKKWENSPLQFTFGASFVSVYDKAETRYVTDATTGDQYKIGIPENVGAAAERFSVLYKNWNLNAEFAQRGQDPNAVNEYIFHKGNAAYITTGYSIKGLGINLAAKSIDNMSFKSRRNETGNMLNVNYLPALTKQHSYSLFNMYPYATQVNGEVGFQADIFYKFKKNTLLGGKYGMDLKLNYSRVNSLDTTGVARNVAGNYEGTDGYTSSLFKAGSELYYEEFNIELTRKITQDLKLNFMYSYQTFNPIAMGHEGEPFVYANIFALDGTQLLSNSQSLKVELQWLLTKQDYESTWAKGDWCELLLEYNFAKHWSVSALDQYNYGTEIGDKVHYYNFAVIYTQGTNRIQVSYGKQRQGVMCIGGVCREVPASNGLFVTITSSF